jgi:hypothetical protein
MADQGAPLFTGVGVALVTLFRDDGSLDAAATAGHAARLAALGVRARGGGGRPRSTPTNGAS